MSCSGGARYYVCSSNGFKGCCTVNACSLTDCPDQNESTPSSSVSTTSSQSSSKSQEETSSTTISSTIPTSLVQSPVLTSAITSPAQSSVSTSTTISQTVPTSQSSSALFSGTLSSIGPQSSTKSSAAISSSTSNASSLAITTSSVSNTSTPLANPASQTSSSTSSSSSPLSCTSHCFPKPKAALIGSVVGGGVTALICLIAIFLWCRRRNKKTKEPLSEERLDPKDLNAASQGKDTKVDSHPEAELLLSAPLTGANTNRVTPGRFLGVPSEPPVYYASRKPLIIKTGQQVRQVPQPSNTTAHHHAVPQGSIPTYLERTSPRLEGRLKSLMSESSLNLQRWESRHANAASMGTIHLCMPCTPAEEGLKRLYVVNPENPDQDPYKSYTATKREDGASWEDSGGRTAAKKHGTPVSSVSGEWSDASSSMLTRRVGSIEDRTFQGSR